MRKRTTLSIAGVAGLFIAAAAPLAASAHVTINPDSAEPGGYSQVTVNVPNESATAATNKVELQLPADTPFSYVGYVPVPGWSVELVKSTLPEPVQSGDSEITEATTSIVWTADAGSEIADGQFQLFEIEVGPVPDTGSIALPAIQTYTDGDVVEWTETTEDADYPAPVLYINDAPVDHHGGADPSEPDADTAAASDASTPAASVSSDDVLARVLGIGGLLVGAVGIVLAVTARRRQAQG